MILNSPCSPSETLSARRKRTCDVCTDDPTRPIMIEEGSEWDRHVKTKVHKRLANLEQHEEMIRTKREEAILRKEAKEKEASVIENAPLLS